MENKNKEILQTSGKERLSYGAYFMGQNIFFMITMQFLMLFYTDYRFISATAVGVIFLVARIWDAVNDPLFGIIVDKSNFKMGKFKPWIAISTILIPIATIFVFAMPESMGASGKIAYAAVTYIIWGMLYTVCDVPIFALATAMTNNIQERTKIIAIGRTAATVAMLILSIVLMPLITAMGWTKAAILISILGLLFMLPINFFAKERFIEESGDSNSGTSIKDIFSYLKGNKYLLIFYLGMIVYSLTNTALTVGNYIAIYMLGGEQMIPAVMMAMILPMMVIAIITPALTKKFDKFHLFIFGIIINMVGCLVGYFVGYDNVALFFIFAVVRGVGYGIFMTLAFMFAADCVEYGDYKTGKRAEGITFSIQTFSTKMTTAIAGSLGAFLMGAIGYDGALDVQMASTMSGMWKAYLLFPLIGMALSLPILYQYKLRDKDVQIMAKFNQKQITREEAKSQLSREY